MDRQGKVKEGFLNGFAMDAGYDKPKGIVAGFIPVCEFAEPGAIISNLAYALSAYGLVVCVTDFKVFYPTLCDWLGGVSADRKGDGLVRLLDSDRTEVKSIALPTDNNNIFLISPSPNDDPEAYFNYSVDDVSRVIALLRETFDVVLIDIPNNPALEFCVGALMHCQRGFFVAAERVDAPRNIQKLMEFALKITNNARGFRDIILSHYQGLVYDWGALNDTRIGGKDEIALRVVARIPYDREIQQCALDGKVYVRDGPLAKRKLTKEGKRFSAEMANLARLILEVDG